MSFKRELVGDLPPSDANVDQMPENRSMVWVYDAEFDIGIDLMHVGFFDGNGNQRPAGGFDTTSILLGENGSPIISGNTVSYRFYIDADANAIENLSVMGETLTMCWDDDNITALNTSRVIQPKGVDLPLNVNAYEISGQYLEFSASESTIYGNTSITSSRDIFLRITNDSGPITSQDLGTIILYKLNNWIADRLSGSPGSRTYSTYKPTTAGGGLAYTFKLQYPNGSQGTVDQLSVNYRIITAGSVIFRDVRMFENIQSPYRSANRGLNYTSIANQSGTNVTFSMPGIMNPNSVVTYHGLIFDYNTVPHSVTETPIQTTGDTITRVLPIPSEIFNSITYLSDHEGDATLSIDYRPYVLPITATGDSCVASDVKIDYFARPWNTTATFELSLDGDNMVFDQGDGIGGTDGFGRYYTVINESVMNLNSFENCIYWRLKYTNGSWLPWRLMNITREPELLRVIVFKFWNASNTTEAVSARVVLSNGLYTMTDGPDTFAVFNNGYQRGALKGLYTATITAEGYETKTFDLYLPGQYQFNVFMMPAEDQAIPVRFTIIDNTGEFPFDNTTLSLHLNDLNKSGLVVSQKFDAQGWVSTKLISNTNYTISVMNSAGQTRSLGYIQVDRAQDVRLVIGDVLDISNIHGNFTFNLTREEGVVSLEWLNNNNYTIPVEMTVVSMSGGIAPYIFNTYSPIGRISYDLPDLNATYRITFYADDNGTPISEVIYYHPARSIMDTSFISDATQNAICIAILIILALLIAPINVKIGSLLVVGTASIMFAMGFLHIALVVLVWAIFIGFAAIFMNPFVRG